MALPVALQLYSVRDEFQKDMLGTLKAVKKMGYSGVEFAGLFGKSAAEIKAMLDEVGLVPVSAHVPLAEMLADPDKTFKTYKDIGCKYVAVPYLPDELRPGADKFEQTLKDIDRLGKIAAGYGLTMLYHNHDFEFIRLEGKYGLDIMYDTIPASVLQTELDLCWVNVGGEDPAEYLRKYAGRAPVVHYKDFSGKKNENMYELIGLEKKAPTRPEGFEFRPVGYGKQDMPTILKATEEAGAEWVVVEQDRPSLGKTTLECAEMSRHYLCTLGW